MKKLKETFDKMTDNCVPQTNVSFSWTAKGIGFGEFVLIWNEEERCLEMYTETMSKEFVKRMLCQMVDDAIVMEI